MESIKEIMSITEQLEEIVENIRNLETYIKELEEIAKNNNKSLRITIIKENIGRSDTYFPAVTKEDGASFLIMYNTILKDYRKAIDKLKVQYATLKRELKQKL